MGEMGKRVAVRSKEEINFLRQSGQITAQALKKVLAAVKPGAILIGLDALAEEEIKRLGGGSSFKTVPGYQFTTCLTLNEEVVHGLPREIKLKKGDILGVDLGAVYQGWHTDAAWSVLVGGSGLALCEQEEKRRFLAVGEETLWKAIKQAVAGGRIGDISAAIQDGIEGAGFAVVKSLAGHGVGRAAHEEPEVPTFGEKGKGMILKEGMSLAIEVIYTAKRGEVWEEKDGWTISSKDGSLGGIFEMSILVGQEKAEVLTDWRKV